MSKRILLVDDDERLVMALKMRLSAQGYEVFTACNGDEGLCEAALFRPDVMILDVRMPKMDGYEVCQLIRTVPELRDIPVIILSASADSQGILTAGGNVFFQKPYHFPKLLQGLREAFESRGITATPSGSKTNS